MRAYGFVLIFAVLFICEGIWFMYKRNSTHRGLSLLIVGVPTFLIGLYYIVRHPLSDIPLHCVILGFGVLAILFGHLKKG